MDKKQSKNLLAGAAMILTMAYFQAAQADVVQETYDLTGFPSGGPIGGVLVLVDTTHVGDIESGHVVATLPVEGDTCEDQTQTPFEGLNVLIGVAPEDLAPVTLENTGIPGATVTFGPPPTQSVATCVFHVDIEPNDIVGRITDVAFINGVECPGQSKNHCALPAGTSIGIAARLGEIGDHGHPQE